MLTNHDVAVVQNLIRLHLGDGAEPRRAARRARSDYVLRSMGLAANGQWTATERLIALRRDCKPHFSVCETFDRWYRREEARLLVDAR